MTLSDRPAMYIPWVFRRYLSQCLVGLFRHIALRSLQAFCSICILSLSEVLLGHLCLSD
jgi:hypothetical protein